MLRNKALKVSLHVHRSYIEISYGCRLNLGFAYWYNLHGWSLFCGTQFSCKPWLSSALSNWCIFHRKKAKEIVDTWASKFHAAPKEQRVPFLYLANDILQNSRRKGPEFVNAFWTVLPAVLRDVLDTGDDSVRNSANRLVRRRSKVQICCFWFRSVVSGSGS